MTDDKGVARSWLEGLAARGVTVSLRNGRLELRPPHAYKALTDDELITLRRHRQAIKELVKAGIPLEVRTAPLVENVQPMPGPCPYCYRTPCISVDHPAFYVLHPIEAQRRHDEQATAEMRALLGKTPLL